MKSAHHRFANGETLVSCARRVSVKGSDGTGIELALAPLVQFRTREIETIRLTVADAASTPCMNL